MLLKHKKLLAYANFRILIKSSLILLFIFIHSTYCSTFSISVTNELNTGLYVDARKIEPSIVKILTYPNYIHASGHPGPRKIFFKDSMTSHYFEIYFGKFKNDQNCTFVYEIPRGLFIADCPEFNHKISTDRKNIVLF